MKNNQRGNFTQRNELDICLRLLWRRRTLVLTPACLFTLLAIVFWLVSPQRYSATALLILDDREPRDAHTSAMYDSPKTPLFIRGEMEVLRSSSLLQSLITKENLASDPEFVTPPIHNWNQIRIFFGAEPSPQKKKNATDATLLEMVRQSVNISQLNRALVIGVSVRTQSPEKSAHLANRLVDLYLSYQSQTKVTALQKSSLTIKNKLHRLKDAVYKAETAVIAFQKSHNLGQEQNPSLTERHQHDLVHQIAKAKAHRASVEGALQSLQRAQKSGHLHEISDATTSTNIRQLVNKQTDLQNHLAELETRYGPKHPRIRHTKTQLSKIADHLHLAFLMMIRNTEHQVTTARYKEKALEEELHLLTRQQHAEKDAIVHLHELERHAEAQRKSYKNLLNQLQDITHRIDLEHPNIRLLSKALPPDRPSGFPRPALVASGLFIGLLFGMAAAAIREHLDHTLRDPEEVLPRLGIPMAGVIPFVKTQTLPTYEDNIEDLRNLTQSLLPLCKYRKAPVIAVTSSVPGEGKTTLTYHIGQVLARSGKRTLLIDADLRRPGLSFLAHHSLETATIRAHTLASVLEGSDPPEKAVIPLGSPGLSLIPGTLLGTRAPDLLEGPHVESLLQYARRTFDIIIFDTPPILPVADTCIITKLCHKILFAIRWNNTPDVSMRHALERLNRQSPQAPVSAILTMMDLRKQTDYDYGRYVQRYCHRYNA